MFKNVILLSSWLDAVKATLPWAISFAVLGVVSGLLGLHLAKRKLR
jgi:hypothetical protein